ncbi:unnamed protein product [Penicillium camemberti]|uniref:Str. FM013 n=1 Tax=Penicillium camemberti (strain FM 013) TaxID=1429867 RepID=A0A0G4PWV7_PENC3|nr:unnamed protein product [Penicillium camemberti]
MTRENIDIRFPWPRSIIEYNGDRNNRLQDSEPVYSGNPTFSPTPITDLADTGTADSMTEHSHPTSYSCGCQGSESHN